MRTRHDLAAQEFVEDLESQRQRPLPLEIGHVECGRRATTLRSERQKEKPRDGQVNGGHEKRARRKQEKEGSKGHMRPRGIEGRVSRARHDRLALKGVPGQVTDALVRK